MFVMLLLTTTTTAQTNCQGMTYSQGGWGAPNGNPATNYLSLNFSSAFPSGLTLGCNDQLVLTTATDVIAFLPSGTTPAALPSGTLTDPGNSYSNVLAGQLVALMLNATFDAYDPSFSSASIALPNYSITSGPFTGMSVGNFIALANSIIGGCSTQYSYADLNAAAASINLNYHEGVEDTGFLTCGPICNMTASAVSGNILCNGGTTSVLVSAIGGTAPFTGDGTFIVSAGISSYTITDTKGCTATVSASVSEPPVLVAVVTAGNILCNGGSTNVNVNGTGGTSPYTGTAIYNVTAGTYSYQITDANGCQAERSIEVTEPELLVLGATKSDVTCYGGTGLANASAVGGTSPYAFSWNTAPSQNSAAAQLPVGNWNVSVVDANGCTNAVNGLAVALLPCSGFVTASQGGWGAGCNGGNWGCYRNTNFAGAFPNGLVLGTGSKQVKLTSAAAVDAFLPSSTTPRALNNGTLTNPGSSYKNVLAGQAAALKLSIGFDNWSSGFSPSTSPLSGLIISSGTFEGWSVAALLNEADNILGGVSSMYTATQVNDALNNINLNYDGGTQNLGYLACSCASSNRSAFGANNEAISISSLENSGSELAGFPNPFADNSNVSFRLEESGNVSVNVYSFNGQLVQTLYNGEVNANEEYNVVFNGSNLTEGIYFVTLNSKTGSVVKKLVLTK